MLLTLACVSACLLAVSGSLTSWTLTDDTGEALDHAGHAYYAAEKQMYILDGSWGI